MSVPITLDFSEDLRRFFADALQHLGAQVPTEDDVDSLGCAYFNLVRRLIPVGPRDVRRSRELMARSLDGSIAQGIDMIEREARAGADLRPRLHGKISDAEYDDALLNDWGIHHLHLGTTLRADGFYERGATVLFVLVTDEVLFCIDVGEHGAEHFDDQRLLQVVHDNWPEAIAESRSPGVPGTLNPPMRSPESRRLMRQKFTIATMVRDGTIYLPHGGGIVTTGRSLEVRRSIDNERRIAHAAEEWARANAERIHADLERIRNVRLDALHFQYMPVERRVLEKQTEMSVEVPSDVVRGLVGVRLHDEPEREQTA